MQASNERVAAFAYATIVALTVAWIAGAILLPLSAGAQAGDSNGLTISSLIHYTYGRVCHQIAERSFHIHGQPVAVCARCLGIYVGYLAGLVVYPFARSIGRADAPPRLWFLLASIPVTIDFFGGYFGVFENTLVSRAVTGMIVGAAGAFYTLPGLVSMVCLWFKQREDARQRGAFEEAAIHQ